MAPSDPVRRLLAVVPTEFTVARNRLVAALRQAGRGEEARAVARLRKPSPALWVTNQLARTDRRAVAAFIDAVARLRRTQLQDARVAGDALRAQRAALKGLVDNARELLTRADLAASRPTLRRVSDTLMGAAVDRRHAEALRHGELAEELPAPGFEAFGPHGGRRTSDTCP